MPCVIQLCIKTKTLLLSLSRDAGSTLSSTSQLDADNPHLLNPEDIPLWLPAALPASLRVGELISQFLDFERRLHLAQLDDTPVVATKVLLLPRYVVKVMCIFRSPVVILHWQVHCNTTTKHCKTHCNMRYFIMTNIVLPVPYKIVHYNTTYNLE